jgi:hypothetical protein
MGELCHLGIPETKIPREGAKAMRKETICAGCGGTIVEGEIIWVSDIGEEENVITHPLAECLKKYIKPEMAYFVEESD